MKKVSAIIVCCLLAAALIALPVLAAQTATFTVKASKTTVDPGDVITVTISTTQLNECGTFGVTLVYDASKFEPVVGSAKCLVPGMSGGDISVSGKVNFFFKALPALIGGTPYTGSGDAFEVQLKVKDSAVGSSALSMTAAQIEEDATAATATSTVTIKVNCDHVWGTWADNGANHKRTCTKCGEPQTGDHAFGEYTVTSPAGCDKAGEKTAICSACGADDKKAVEATENHVWGDWTKVDDTNHKRTCTTCTDGTPAEQTNAHTWGTASVTTPAGCDKAGEKTQTCTVATCGATKKTAIEATSNHTFTGAWTKVDDTNHKRTCTTCTDGTPAVETKAHTWGTWTEVTPADCKNDGQEKRECTDNCGAVQTKPIPATGEHGYQTWTKVDDEKHTAVCSGCGEFPKTENHTWDNGTEKTPAGCDKAGVKLYTCTATGCGATKEEPIAPTGEHTFGGWTKVDDTNHKRVCTTCTDGTPETETVAHTWDNGTVKTPAGCDKAGVKLYTCTATGCGATKEEAIEATGGHTYGEWVKVDATNHKRTCTTCQDGTPVEQTEAHKAGTEYKADTTNHWFECVCGEKMTVAAHTYDQVVGDADGHSEGCVCGTAKPGATKVAHTWDDGVVTKKPSKDEYGVKTYTCTTCKYERTERIDKVTSPNTGDNTLVIPMVILAVLSACGLAVTVVARKRASR